MGNLWSSDVNTTTSMQAITTTASGDMVYSVRLKPFSKSSVLKYEIVCKATHGELLSSVISKVNAFRRPGKEIQKIFTSDGTEIAIESTPVYENMVIYS
jgi:hypothetical protein